MMTTNERNEMLGKVRVRAIEQLSDELEGCWPEIVADLDRACIEASKCDKRAKFAINCCIKLEPAGKECGLIVKASWGNRKSVETIREQVSLQPELFGKP